MQGAASQVLTKQTDRELLWPCAERVLALAEAREVWGA